MAAKLGYEAIQYILTKTLTKKGVKGIARIPGKAYALRMKQLVDEMAKKMKALGYDINKVTQKDVQGLLDSAEAVAKQKKPTIEGLLKGEKYTDERGRVWDFGTKDRPFPGWKPKIVPKDRITDWWKPRPGKGKKDVEEVFFDHPDDPRLYKPKKEIEEVIPQEVIPKETPLTKDDFFRIKQGLSTKIKLNTLGENQQLAKTLIGGKNAEFNSLNRTSQKEILDRLTINIKNAKADFATPVKPDDLASGGIARVGYAGGLLAKGAKWFLGSLKKNLTDLRANHPRFKGIPVEEQKMLMEGYETFIKQLEAGGEVPKEALEAISKNPQYYKTKKVVRSQDPDLAEVEELIDEKVFGHVRQELKDLETVGRKPNASGGIAGQLHLNEGGRAPFGKGDIVLKGLFAGSEGLRALIKRLRGKEKTLFPKPSRKATEFGKLTIPKATETLKSLNLQQLENLLDALKIDKQAIKQIEVNKQMKDPGLDFLMGEMRKDKSWGLDMEQLGKYTDIDKDIMVVEQMLKNKTMKGRKLQATGGRVSYTKGGLAHVLGV